MTTDLAHLSAPRGPANGAVSQATAIEQARAVAEVAAAVRVAQEFPRDMTRCIDRMRQACQQRALADRAFYSLPRAGGRVEGSTVHLARELAACYGNIDYGIRETRRDDDAGESEMQAWAWDQETNVRSSRSFVVPHARMAGKGAAKKREALVDLGDIANNNNSVAARAVRETIFTILPIGFRVEAEEIAARTLQDGGGKSMDQQIADAVGHYVNAFDVTKAQLEERLQRPSKDWTPQNLGSLRVLAGELARGEKTVEQEFPAPDRRVTTEDLTRPPAKAPEPADDKPAETPASDESLPIEEPPYDPTNEPTWNQR